MVQSVTENTKTDYFEIRNEFKNGDILLYKGRTWISKAIQWFTGSEYSHAGIVAWWNDRLMVLESVDKGVVVTPMSNNIKKYWGDVEWFQSIEEISDEQRLKMLEYAQEELGKEYNQFQILIIGFKILLGQNVKHSDKLRKSKKLFCSHYVSSVYNYIGMDLKEKLSDDFTSPDDIAKSPKLVKKAVLKIQKIKK